MSINNCKVNVRRLEDVINNAPRTEKRWETNAAKVPRKTCNTHKDFASDAIDAAEESDGSSDSSSGRQPQRKKIVITLTTTSSSKSSRHGEKKAKIEIQRRADDNDDISFRIDGENNIIANLVGAGSSRCERRKSTKKEKNPQKEEAEKGSEKISATDRGDVDAIPDCHEEQNNPCQRREKRSPMFRGGPLSLRETLRGFREIEEMYGEVEIHRGENSADESNEPDFLGDCNNNREDSDKFVDAREDDDNEKRNRSVEGRGWMRDAGGETVAYIGIDKTRSTRDTSTFCGVFAGISPSDGEKNDPWQQRDAQSLRKKVPHRTIGKVATPNGRATCCGDEKSRDETKRRGERSREEDPPDEEEGSPTGRGARDETKHREREISRDEKESHRRRKKLRIEKRVCEEKPSDHDANSCVEKRIRGEKSSRDDEPATEEKRPHEENRFPKKKISTGKKRSTEVKRLAEKKRSVGAKPASHKEGSRAKNRAHEDPRSSHAKPTHESADEAATAKTFGNAPKSHRQAVEKQRRCWRENNSRKTPDNDDSIEKSSRGTKDPRLLPDSKPIVLLPKLKQEKTAKGLTIVEPPFLPSGDRRAASSNIVRVNKPPDKQSTLAAKSSPAPLSPSEFYGSPRGPLPQKLSKKNLALSKRIKQKIHVRDQKRRRVRHSWADVLPISKQPLEKPAREQIEQIKSQRKERLRRLAERKKNTDFEEDSLNATAKSVAEESTGKRVVAQSVKVTNVTRGYFLLSKPPEKRAKLKTATLQRTSPGKMQERGKENSDSSNVEGLAIGNGLWSESEDDEIAIENCPAFELPTIDVNSTKIADGSPRIDVNSTKIADGSPRIDVHSTKIPDGSTRIAEDSLRIAENSLRIAVNSLTIAENSLTIAEDSPRIAQDSPRTEESSKSIPKEPQALRVIEEPKRPKKIRRVSFDDSATKTHVFDCTATVRTCSPNELAPLWGRSQYEQRFIDWNVPVDPALGKFLCQIFEWNPSWLTEQNHVAGLPPVVDEDKLVAMLPEYRTYDEYYRAVEPLLALELWHRISKDYEEKKRRPWRYSVSKSKIEVFPADGANLCMSILELDTVDNFEDPPAHGDLVIFNYVSKWSHGCGFPVRKAFAYVASVQKVRRPYTILTKPLIDAKLGCGDLQPISCIRPDMRSVQALRYLPMSPLVNIILHPRLEDYRLPTTNDLYDYPLVTKDCLNARQLEAVARITDAVAQKLPRVCLIQGPPGTGKSRVIVNLITQIIHGGRRLPGYERTQVLMCAPSNAAVDEVVLRLMNVNRMLEAEEMSFSIVRTGRAETMNPLVTKVSLTELARKNIEQLDLIDAPRYGSVYHGMDERAKTARICQEEVHLLLDADVIACTLNSCYTDQMASIFGRSEAISVCIVDEATQSVEPDTLIPLMLGVKTLVLVGDTNQLPATVISQKAKQLGLDRSLFARISEVFEGEPGNPIIKLDTQYRMSNPIALFPNRHFYNGALKNAARMRKLPLHFYRVFNLNSTQNFDRFSNSNEANFIANLMYTLIARANYDDAILPVKIGVITPYNNQKKLLRKRISERISCLKDQKKIEYEVNTVDSFQGQERDIVIMSCVRSNGIGFLADRQRLCVALTRAKHSLILCGNFKTFENDPTWKALLQDAKDRKVYINLPASVNPNAITAFIVR